MRTEILTALTLIYFSMMVFTPVEAQNNCVKVKLEIDGQEIKQKFKIIVYVGDEVIEPTVFQNAFAVPPSIRESEEVNVRFRFGDYNLFFESVNVSKFQTNWIVGVDTKPFEAENTDSEDPGPPGKELLGIYYLNFTSKKGLDTRMVVREYK